ncbi:MAG TPA: hypothetical protein VMT89_12435, partial [Candidatus Acidoferrales bacterium]|nr:hypothetical protein [Candidatus Acidoferrales bacterium]
SFLLSAPDEGWVSPALMRIPFLFAAGVFYGYVVLPERTGDMIPMSRKSSVHVINRPPAMAQMEAR